VRVIYQKYGILFIYNVLYTNIDVVCAVHSAKGKDFTFLDCQCFFFLKIIRESVESNTVNGPEVFLSTDISYHA
jgi:hypothetical protein